MINGQNPGPYDEKDEGSIYKKNFEEVKGWKIPVMERAGKSVRSIAKTEPLKMEGFRW